MKVTGSSVNGSPGRAGSIAAKRINRPNFSREFWSRFFHQSKNDEERY